MTADDDICIFSICETSPRNVVVVLIVVVPVAVVEIVVVSVVGIVLTTTPKVPGSSSHQFCLY